MAISTTNAIEATISTLSTRLIDSNIISEMPDSATSVNSSSRCKILANSPPSFALAPLWSNIPETFLFNAVIAVVLYIVFVILSKWAWSRRSLMKEFVECTIIEFLYGYRDPERWVAMPRFEFIHRAKRHHQHEVDFPYLYISPRLVAYDPNSILKKELKTRAHNHPSKSNIGVAHKHKEATNQTSNGKKNLLDSPGGEGGSNDASSRDDSPESPTDSLLVQDMDKMGQQMSPANAKSPSPVETLLTGQPTNGGKQNHNQSATGQNLTKPIGKLESMGSHKEASSTSDRLDIMLSSGARRGRPLSSLNRHLNRSYLNLPYSKDPVLSPALAAKLESTQQRAGGHSGEEDEMNQLEMSLNRLDRTSSVIQNDSRATSHKDSQDLSKRSRLEIRDANINLNVEDLHVIISHLERANWLTKRLNRAFQRFSNITDIDLIYCKGIDAYEYLLFQRHMILLLIVINLLCLGLILPVHLTGNGLQGEPMGFRHTTIRNLTHSTMLYWAHIISSFVILVTAIYLLGSYKSATITKNEILVSRRTLLVSRLSDELLNKKRLHNVFREAFPQCHIEAIQYVYDTRQLELYQQYLESMIVAREYCQLYKQKYNETFMVKPTGVNEKHACNGNCRICSCCLVCLCYWPCECKVNGSGYYSLKEKAFRMDIDNECRRLVRHPYEAAFITFKSHKQTSRVYEAIKNKNFSLATSGGPIKVTLGADKDKSSSTKTVPVGLPAHVLETSTQRRLQQLMRHMNARYAPHPDNVEYRDLLLNSTTGFLTQLLLNLLMIVIFLFLSTPTVVFKYLSQIEADKMIKGEIPQTFIDSSLYNYAFVLLQVLATVMLPTFIQLISQSIPYSDSATKNHSIMWKVFLFTMLMVVVLPSFGLTTSTALIMSFIDQNKNIDMRCIFPTDNGAFFINYIISSSVIPPFMELLKPSDVFIYFFIMITGRSKADFEQGRQFIGKEFAIGIQYTKFLLNLAVVLCYTISCPLIAPFGLIYMVFKHQVDKYNLYYTYYTSKVDIQTQRTVEVFIRLALVLMLLQSSIAISLNTGIGYFSLISQILFWFALATFLNNCFFDCTSSTAMWQKRIRFQREFCACFYLPGVFEDLLKENALPSDCTSFKT